MIPAAIIHELNCRAAIRASQFGQATYQAYIPRQWWTEDMLLRYEAEAVAITMFVEEPDFTRDGGSVTLDELTIRLPLMHPSLDNFGDVPNPAVERWLGADIEIQVYPKASAE